MGEQKKSRVSLLGTGLMGSAIVGRLLAAGYPVTVYNRTRAKAERLAQAGASVADRPADAFRSAECVLLMLADAPALRGVLSDPEVRDEMRGRTVVQMGTISLAESLEFQREVEGLGGVYMEAPILGGPADIPKGNIFILVGASPEQYERWLGLLRAIAPECWHIGPVGQGAGLKLAMNQMIASMTTTFALSLAFIRRAGVPPETFMELLRKSALYAPTFEKKFTRMLGRDYRDVQFTTSMMYKDVNLFLEEARKLGLENSSLEGTRRLIEIAMDQGLGPADYSSLYAAVDPKQIGE